MNENGLAAYGRLLAYQSVTDDLVRLSVAESTLAVEARIELDRPAFLLHVHALNTMHRIALVTLGKASVWEETATLSGQGNAAPGILESIRMAEYEIGDTVKAALDAVDQTPWKLYS